MKLDFSHDMSYGDYLHLDQLLAAQQPLSSDRNEPLFIIQHQVSELWMKLILHELQDAMACLGQDTVQPALKMLARVARIMTQLVQAWDVLTTLTPTEYNGIRPALSNSSGFQSWQYRCMEFRLGNKNAVMRAPHAHHPARLAAVDTAFRAPSLYDVTLQYMARRALAIPASHLQRDWTQSYVPSSAVESAWRQIYRDPDRDWGLYQLAEQLVDLEEAFRLWRFRHVSTVERVIGFKRGTGGTAGAAYLRKTLGIVLFPELWDVRSSL